MRGTYWMCNLFRNSNAHAYYMQLRQCDETRYVYGHSVKWADNPRHARFCIIFLLINWLVRKLSTFWIASQPVGNFSLNFYLIFWKSLLPFEKLTFVFVCQSDSNVGTLLLIDDRRSNVTLISNTYYRETIFVNIAYNIIRFLVYEARNYLMPHWRFK